MKQLTTEKVRKMIISQKIGDNIDLDPNQIGTENDLRVITPEDIESNLVDNVDAVEEVPQQVVEDIEDYEQQEGQPPFEEVPEFDNVFDAISWTENNDQTMRIHYVTLRGNHLIRDIEPHGHYFSKDTNRSVVVAWDDTIGDIRSFVIMNIVEFEVLNRKFTPKFFFSTKKNRIRKVRHK